MQYWIAMMALLAWPLVTLWLYSTRPINQATIWTILGAYLLLPTGPSIKLAQGIPQLDKVSIPALAALVGCLLFSKRKMRFWNGFGLTELLLLMFLIGPLVTSEQNTDQVVSGSVVLPGVGSYDGLSAMVSQVLFLFPFFLGRRLLRDPADVEEVLRALVIAGLFYSLPMIFEMKMSPQLQNWIYGFSGFRTEMRFGGWRPYVFLGNGLIAAFFMMTTAVSAAAFWRSRIPVQKLPPAPITAYLSVVLILCRSLGALVYGAVLIPLVRFTRPRLQIRIAVILAIFTVAYPLLRSADLVPTKYLVDAAAMASETRADSLEFRFDHEKQLLDRASQRFVFGWGRYGRSRIFDIYGKDVSVSDGGWVIAIGQFGLFGFIGEFGLLAWPVLRAASALRFVESARAGIFLAALALIMAASMIDLLPNDSLSPWTWLIAGALLGRAEALQIARQLQPGNRRMEAIQSPERVATTKNAFRV